MRPLPVGPLENSLLYEPHLAEESLFSDYSLQTLVCLETEVRHRQWWDESISCHSRWFEGYRDYGRNRVGIRCHQG